MFIRGRDYYALWGFLEGLNHGCNGELLKGFDDWVARKLDFPWKNRSSWSILLVRLALPSHKAGFDLDATMSPEEHARVIDVTWDCLFEFLSARHGPAEGGQEV